ncbi:MAG: SUMF1/EgtB/PvdO family nonheme iron enzyme [Candidatus Thiodiazotropha taylori]
MSDIFISYKREEQDKARQLAAALEKQGWSVWWDPKLRAGERFDDVIQQALTDARCVISLLSPPALQSTYVMNETRYALRRNKLIPVVIESVELPFDLEGVHSPSLINWEGDESSGDYNNLLGDIAAILDTPPTHGQQGQRRQSEVPHSTSEVSVRTETVEIVVIEPEMVLIPGGEFEMGSNPEKDSEADNDEQPPHRVEIKPFYLGKYEVTFAEYMAFADTTGCELPGDEDWGRDRRPVINVSWEDAVAYVEWLSQQTGKHYRLPTEAEWEYAARAGSTTKYSWGDVINQDGKVWANCYDCGSQWDGEQTAPVDSFAANAFGLYDMVGNVWEWTQDCWHDDYRNAPSDGSAWLESKQGNCNARVIRGGAWGSIPRVLRSASRNWFNPDVRFSNLGFRLAQDP